MEKFFSLEWFKERMESSVDRALDARIGAKIDALIDQVGGGGEAPRGVVEEQPWKTIKLVNESLTVVLTDGTIVNKPNATEEHYNRVKVARTKDEVLSVIYDRDVAREKVAQQLEADRLASIAEGFSKLACLKDFETDGDSVCLTGTSRSIPELLVERFTEVIGKHSSKATIVELEAALEEDMEYQSLKKFFLKCCLNPNAQSAEDLYQFLSHHQFKIDKHGNFYAYRRVVSLGGKNDKLVQFVSNAYNKVKAVWKKKPKDYRVVECNGNYCLESAAANATDGTFIGNLKDLYLELPNMTENSYTDAHTHTMNYRVGTSSSIPRHEGNDNNSVSCSRGLHIASKAYNYAGFGDMPILAIINPMDVLAVPRGEVGKLRTCRWFFASTLTEEEQHILDDDCFDVSELGDIFEEECLEGMQLYTQKSFADEVKRHTFNLPSISASEIKSIVLSLKEMKASITKRVSMI